jgi:type II secretory pathway pseudopilin PulG
MPATGQLYYRRNFSSLEISSGFTYMGLLLVIFIMGAALAGTGVVFHQQARREKEKQLLFVGDQYRRAIGLYYAQTPGGAKKYPKSIDDLLRDNRFVVPRRYLRRVYRDPITNSSDWGLVNAADGGISGVFSRSEKIPIKSANFLTQYESFQTAVQYADWKFVYDAPPSNPVKENQEVRSSQ